MEPIINSPQQLIVWHVVHVYMFFAYICVTLFGFSFVGVRQSIFLTMLIYALCVCLGYVECGRSA